MTACTQGEQHAVLSSIGQVQACRADGFGVVDVGRDVAIGRDPQTSVVATTILNAKQTAARGRAEHDFTGHIGLWFIEAEVQVAGARQAQVAVIGSKHVHVASHDVGRRDGDSGDVRGGVVGRVQAHPVPGRHAGRQVHTPAGVVVRSGVVGVEKTTVTGGQQVNRGGHGHQVVHTHGAGRRQAHITGHVGGQCKQGVGAHGQAHAAQGVGGAAHGGVADQLAIVQAGIAVAVAENLHRAAGFDRAGQGHAAGQAGDAVLAVNAIVAGTVEHRGGEGWRCGVDGDVADNGSGCCRAAAEVAAQRKHAIACAGRAGGNGPSDTAAP